MAEAKIGVCRTLVINVTSRTKQPRDVCTEMRGKACGKCRNFYPGVAIVTEAVSRAALDPMEARAAATVLRGVPLPDGIYYHPALSACEKLTALAGGVACRDRECPKPATYKTRRGYMACEDHKED